MDFKLIWTNRAIGDLAEIVRYYVEEEQNAEAAHKVGTAILDRVEVLRMFPDIGPRYPRGHGIHREVLCFTFRIFYRVDHEARVVYIARVWQGSQDPVRLELQ